MVNEKVLEYTHNMLSLYWGERARLDYHETLDKRQYDDYFATITTDMPELRDDVKIYHYSLGGISRMDGGPFIVEHTIADTSYYHVRCYDPDGPKAYLAFDVPEFVYNPEA